MDEKMLILKMLESGKINADETYKLLVAIDNKKSNSNNFKFSNQEKTKKTKSYLHITLEKTSGEKSNVKIPISIARMGLNAGSKFSKDLNGVNINEIINKLETEDEIFTIINSNNETITLKLI
ncbi:MAG: hypothetical protein JW924_07755 [Fusobacteriaceae bacterium]|nr:hypothetical protein [Fusobacteriaceae bacterium]